MSATEQRAALVTGAAGGIGMATCKRLIGAGWGVAVADVDARRAQSAAERLGSAAIAIAMNVTDSGSVERGFADALAHFGRLDLAINNAGIQRAGPITEVAWSDWAEVIDVNLHGVMRGLRCAGRIMLEAGRGCVVNVSSVTAERGCPDRSAYAVSKAGVISLTRCAAIEWAPCGVRVNAIAPGYVETELVRSHSDIGSLDLAAVVERTPLGRLAEPDEVARAIEFLGTDASQYMTGQVLYLDGGFLADYGVGGLRPAPVLSRDSR